MLGLSDMLRFAFSVDKSTSQNPKKTDIAIYNLSLEHRKQLQKQLPVILSAGYADISSIIFQGTIDVINHIREEASWVSKLSCLDSAQQYNSTRISKTYAKGTPTKQLLMDAAASLGVGIGNTLQAIAGVSARKQFDSFLRGVSISGPAANVLDSYASSYGFNWSIQDGQLQFTQKPGTATKEPVFSITPQSGLIGTPEYGENGTIKFRCLLNSELHAGRQISLTSPHISGFFTLEKVRHSGDTWGADWISDVECREYKIA
jgi:hypothetical protein